MVEVGERQKDEETEEGEEGEEDISSATRVH